MQAGGTKYLSELFYSLLPLDNDLNPIPSLVERWKLDEVTGSYIFNYILNFNDLCCFKHFGQPKEGGRRRRETATTPSFSSLF